MTAIDSPPPRDPRTINRPDPILLKYYMIVACFGLIVPPVFVILIIERYIRYKTLRYRFDDEGVWMAWGLLFRREINLAYRRIQDIHVSRGVIQRWLGIANVSIQTASGNSSPEMVIEGLLDPDGLRDFLYARMRGARGDVDIDESDTESSTGDPTLQLLTQIRDGVLALSDRVRALEGDRQ